jgi:hypothetical protein
MLRTFLGVARVIGVINLVLVCNASIFSIAPLRRFIYIYIVYIDFMM